MDSSYPTLAANAQKVDHKTRNQATLPSSSSSFHFFSRSNKWSNQLKSRKQNPGEKILDDAPAVCNRIINISSKYPKNGKTNKQTCMRRVPHSRKALLCAFYWQSPTYFVGKFAEVVNSPKLSFAIDPQRKLH